MRSYRRADRRDKNAAIIPIAIAIFAARPVTFHRKCVDAHMAPNTIKLLKVGDLLDNEMLMRSEMKSCDILDQHWKAKGNIDEVFRAGVLRNDPMESAEGDPVRRDDLLLGHCWQLGRHVEDDA